MRYVLLLALFLLPESLVRAEDNGALSGWEVGLDGEVVAVWGPGRSDVAGLEAEKALYELSARAKAEKVLDNGAAIGARLTMRLQKDHPARAGFTGNPGVVATGVTPIRTAFSGLTLAGVPEDSGARGSIETAFIYIDGGYGELSLGRDKGVAARFFEGAPDVFTHSRSSDGYLDISGLNIVRTRNDLTGPAAKLSYTTPRILGVRAGLSFTPVADVRGLDRDPARGVAGIIRPRLRNAIEAGVQASRRLRGSGVRLRGSVTWSRADIDTSIAGTGFRPVQTFSAGAEAEWETFGFGASVLTSNNGLRGDGNYTAWSFGAKTTQLGLDWAANYSQGSDDGVGLKGRNWSIGATYELWSNLKLTAGWQSQSLETRAGLVGIAPIMPKRTSDGPVVEITLPF